MEHVFVWTPESFILAIVVSFFTCCGAILWLMFLVSSLIEKIVMLKFFNR